MIDKVKKLEELRDCRGILCHGCFDILHIGHIRSLKVARSLSAQLPLIVTLTADRFIMKGPGRPCFPESVRAECVAALMFVDWVAIVDEATALTAIRTIRPRYMVKGREYENMNGTSKMEKDELTLLGGQLVYTERFADSTRLVKYAIEDCPGV